MRKVLSLFVVASCLCNFAMSEPAPAQTPNIVEIWSGVKMPGKTTEPLDYSKAKKKPSRDSVKNATISIYKVDSTTPTGCVIICPGGGYNNLANTKSEGSNIAEFLNKSGITAVVLEYRVPNNFDGALMDAQRAIRLVRDMAKDLNINPQKVAIMGFSAGASLSARASTNFKTNSYTPLDDTDKLSARPDYTILIYPAYCSQFEKDRRMKKAYDFSEDFDKRYAIADWNVVDKDTPSAFITQTQFDPYGDAAIAYYLALKKEKIPAELHLLSEGKHGYKDKAVFAMLAKHLKKLGY